MTKNGTTVDMMETHFHAEELGATFMTILGIYRKSKRLSLVSLTELGITKQPLKKATKTLKQ